MSPLFEICKFYADLFANEHFAEFDMTKPKVLQKVAYFVERGYLSFDESKKNVRIANKEISIAFIDFFSNLINPLIDTYLVTLAAIEQICGKNLVLKQKSFVQELHSCIKQLYQDRVLPHLHSCLIETIETAIMRYEQLGFVERRAYVTKKGNTTLFMHCPAESKPKIDVTFSQLSQHRKLNQSQQEQLFNQIDEAIVRT